MGLAQVNPTVGAIEANARLVVDWIERARGAGCDLVAFPELALTGYPPEDLLFKPAFIEANIRALADVAKQSRGLTAFTVAGGVLILAGLHLTVKARRRG